MALILHIDTATTVCSVAISEKGILIDAKEIIEANQHTKLVNTLISELLTDNSLIINDINAVSLTVGPGSYTGLRVGMGTAKGICYGLDLPLIPISTLEALSSQYLNVNKKVLAALDARRDEVYMAIFDQKGARLCDDCSFIVPKDRYPENWPNPEDLIICGNAAGKVGSLINESKVTYYDIPSLAKYQVKHAFDLFLNDSFDNIFYAKPNYLKPPNITKSKK